MTTPATPAVDVTGLEARFRLTEFLPLVALTGLLALLIASGAPARGPSVDRLQSTWEEHGWLFVGVSATIALLGAVVLQPFQIGLVRILEGYWATIGCTRPFFELSVELQQRRRENIERRRNQLRRQDRAFEQERASALDALLTHFPPEDQTLPTSLGNALRAGEIDAGGRYGLSTIACWPRIYPLLSDVLRTQVSHHQDQIDANSRLAVGLGMFTPVFTVVLIPHGGAWKLLPIATLILSAIAYRSAVAGARLLNVVLATTFDLHRFDLLTALHLPLPRSSEDERSLNETLSILFEEGRESTLWRVVRYDHSGRQTHS